MRRTSKFPPNKWSEENYQRFTTYANFIHSLPSHRRVLFADEKGLKEKDIFGESRRDPVTGVTYQDTCKSANSRIRWNLFGLLNLQMANSPITSYWIGDVRGNAETFQESPYETKTRLNTQKYNFFPSKIELPETQEFFIKPRIPTFCLFLQ